MSCGVLILGLGQIGMGYDLHLDPAQHIYSHTRAFSQHPYFHIMAAVDPEAQKRDDFERAYRCPVYSDIDTALKMHKPELVVIAVPTRQHGGTLKRVLDQAHLKIVLCEKPLSYDLKEAEFMVRSCTAKGVSLYVNYMRRSEPGVVEIKRRLDAGEIKTPIKGVTWYSKGFLHNGSHLFNMLEYWLGPMATVNMLDPGRLWGNTDSEPDVSVTFEKGAIVFLAAWEEAFSHYTVELLSTNGRLRYEQEGKTVLWQPCLPDPYFVGYKVLSAQPEVLVSGMDRYQWHVADQLSKAMEGRSFNLCTGTEALTTLKFMQRIIEMR